MTLAYAKVPFFWLGWGVRKPEAQAHQKPIRPAAKDGQIMSVVTKNQFRVALACFLCICLFATAAATLRHYGQYDSAANSNTPLFTPILASTVASALADGKRTRLNGFDDLLKAAAAHGKILIVFARQFSAFLFDPKAAASQSTGRAATPTRAPPFIHSF